MNEVCWEASDYKNQRSPFFFFDRELSKGLRSSNLAQEDISTDVEQAQRKNLPINLLS